MTVSMCGKGLSLPSRWRIGAMSTRLRRCVAFAGILFVVALASQAFGDEYSLAALRKKGYVRVCADAANLPFSSEENTATPGFEVELARLIAHEIGRWVTFHRLLQSLGDDAPVVLPCCRSSGSYLRKH